MSSVGSGGGTHTFVLKVFRFTIHMYIIRPDHSQSDPA